MFPPITLPNEWYLFWLPSILLFYLINQDFKVSYDAFGAQQRQVHKYFRSVDPFQVFWFVQFNIKSVNEKVKYLCSICEKEFTAKGDVKIHIESVHEKVKYPCNQCEYKATVKKKFEDSRWISSFQNKVSLWSVRSTVCTKKKS